MSLQSILDELRNQRAQIDQAISALEGSQHPVHPAKASGKKRRQMSAKARARIGAAKKAWWAKQKRTTAGTKSRPRLIHSANRKPMSSAARKKLSALMKARWAQRKKAA